MLLVTNTCSLVIGNCTEHVGRATAELKTTRLDTRTLEEREKKWKTPHRYGDEMRKGPES